MRRPFLGLKRARGDGRVTTRHTRRGILISAPQLERRRIPYDGVIHLRMRHIIKIHRLFRLPTSVCLVHRKQRKAEEYRHATRELTCCQPSEHAVGEIRMRKVLRSRCQAT